MKNKSINVKLSKEVQKKIKEEFYKRNGYLTKLVQDNQIIGYLARCEAVFPEGCSSEKKMISFIDMYITGEFSSFNFYKHFAMDAAIKRGDRFVKEYMKNPEIIKNDKTIYFNCLPDEYYEVFSQTDLNPAHQKICSYIINFKKKMYDYYKCDENKLNFIWNVID